MPKNFTKSHKKSSVKPKKKYGQNFLKDEGIISEIVDIAGVTSDDNVLEIGPGLGDMTRFLCDRAHHVTAVEIDESLIEPLSMRLAARDNLTIIYGDIMKQDLDELFAKAAGGAGDAGDAGKVKVVANLPYYITTPIVTMLLENDLPITSITVMVQKEVAQRMVAPAGSKDVGALSYMVQYHSEASIELEVPPEAFYPAPKVTSAVVHMDMYDVPPVNAKDEALMFRLIRASFNQRRKTLANGIEHGAGLNITKDEIRGILTDMGLSETIRGEKLSLAQFAELSDRILG